MRIKQDSGAHWMASMLVLAAVAFPLVGCESVQDGVDDVKEADMLHSVVTGQVTDNRGEPLAGVTVELFDLLANTNFVEGGNITAGEAYIDREAILASDNSRGTATTADDGTFEFDGVFPSAFLAVATKNGCTADFAGFDEETGVLSVDTLITPDGGLDFAVPTFVLACATAPEVGPDGNTDDAPAFEPPSSPPTCSEALCTDAGGACDAGTCVFSCNPTACAAAGGSCEAGACVLPTCNEAACTAVGGTCNGDLCEVAACNAADCTAAGGTCSADGTSCDIPACLAVEAACDAAGGRCSADGQTCELPSCTSDADCEAGQEGAFCADAGDIDLAACSPPLPGEIVPPTEVTGWTTFKITDTDDKLLADASGDNQAIAAADIPETGLVRVFGKYTGDADTAYVQIQSGGKNCPDLPVRTDFIAVPIVDGALAGGFLETYLHGGQQRIALSTSATLGEGEQSYVVDVGAPCTPPLHPFVAILTWSAGPSQPADLDLNVWNSAGELVFIGKKQAAWGQLAREGRTGPGPEVFWASDVSKGPFTIKVLFFSGRPRSIEGKVRILRIIEGELHDDSYVFTVEHPKDVTEIGVFASQ